MKLKYIHTIHHYLGTFFFGMFLIWFLSGFVMMYKNFPFLSEKDRISGQETIRLTSVALPHPTAVFHDHLHEDNNSLRVNSLLGQPVYHLITKEGKLISRLAYTSEAVRIDKPLALKIAKKFTGITSEAQVTVLDRVDQWIPRPKYAKHLPVFKVCFADESGTYVHISSKTGEVISNTSRADRVWAWFGAIPHWIYLKEIRKHQTLWSQLCIWLSLLGLIAALSGIATGIVRHKKTSRAKFKRFKDKWYNFHYYAGLIFGVFVCTWVFSGFMSMTPFNWSSDFELSAQERFVWEARSSSLEKITENEWGNFHRSLRGNDLKEASFSSFSEKLFSEQFFADSTISICLSDLDYLPTEKDISLIINSLDTSDSIVGIELLENYDSYYYDRNNNKELPVFRATTHNQIAYYVSPLSGKTLLRSSLTHKLDRWLYHGLHSWDFSFLTDHRPLWDIFMIILLLGGTTVCATGTGLAIKFIKRKRRRHAVKATR